ncbi:microtubule organization protein AKNA-like [Phycodurus eques]|uniref:microtubule organization protein AKNA-like n=1 Tax=Phycodurus eques TaxID=693459 RepID=UPI002ACEA03F|nr:microtubule organization protein AKNA-like [Phycodurus eques]
MEGEPEDFDEDFKEERKTTLLWEKCIQQRIVVDLSEDESLHLSDLRASSLALHLSQDESAVSEAGIHFSDDIASDAIIVRSEMELPMKSSILQNEELLNQPYEDPGQNTSDEDQEDLPYDGNLGSPYFSCINSARRNVTSDQRQMSTKNQSPDGSHVEKVEEEHKQNEEVAPPSTHPPVDINKLMLRHFSREELLQTGRLIEAETLPEVSLLESADSDGNEQREGLEEDNTASSRDESDVTPSKCEECEVPIRKMSHLRSRSFGELKYGQGQVHYPLPDFSKVAPKVKIPKIPSSPVRFIPQVPSPMIRAQSSPGILDVISRVLEDSDLLPSEKPQVLKDTNEQTSPSLVHHLQAEYDKLLTKYARAENLIDKIRLGTNVSSDICVKDDLGNSSEGSHVGPVAPHIPTSGNIVEKVKTTNQDEMEPNNKSHQECTNEAEKMTAELRAVISQFMQMVDDFKQSVNNMSVSTEEQQMMLRSLMEAQDQLERKYMSKKEEHRTLEMQNYLGLCNNIGPFDPNRLLEGDLFRVGMHLEDIKEMIDKNTREKIVPPLLSSTPKEKTNNLSVKASPPPSLHEGSSVCLTTECFRTETKTEVQKEDEDETSRNDGLEERSEVIINDSMQVSNKFSVCSGVSAEGLLDAKDEENCDKKRESALLEGSASNDTWDGISGKGTQRSEAILALQVEVSRLKKDLEEGLVQLPHLARKMDNLASKYSQDRQERRPKTKARTHPKPISNFASRQLRLEDWISTDMDPSKSTDSGGAETMLQFVGGKRVIRKQETQQGNQEAIMERLYSNNMRSLPSPQSTKKSLLQASYGSSCSLPASYKVKEPPPHVTNHRKRSTQSDTALLPSNVYFQHTLSPVFQRSSSRTGSKKQEVNWSLDQAIEAARSMKRITDRMAKRLMADLAKTPLLPQGNLPHSATRAQETSNVFMQREHRRITRDSFFN